MSEAFTAARGIYCSTRHLLLHTVCICLLRQACAGMIVQVFFYYFTTQSQEINPFIEVTPSLDNTPHQKVNTSCFDFLLGVVVQREWVMFLSVNRDPIVKCLRTRGFVRLCCVAHFHAGGSSQWYLSLFVTNGTITRGETGGNSFILSESGHYSRWTLPHLCLQTIIAETSLTCNPDTISYYQ